MAKLLVDPAMQGAKDTAILWNDLDAYARKFAKETAGDSVSLETHYRTLHLMEDLNRLAQSPAAQDKDHKAIIDKLLQDIVVPESKESSEPGVGDEVGLNGRGNTIPENAQRFAVLDMDAIPTRAGTAPAPDRTSGVVLKA